jgi:hypothetical protein
MSEYIYIYLYLYVRTMADRYGMTVYLWWWGPLEVKHFSQKWMRWIFAGTQAQSLMVLETWCPSNHPLIVVDIFWVSMFVDQISVRW